VRRVVFAGAGRATPVFRRDRLPSGWTRRGPAIVCEYSATTVVPPGWRARIEWRGGIVLTPPARGRR
jgi:N-methylhydantoinase A